MLTEDAAGAAAIESGGAVAGGGLVSRLAPTAMGTALAGRAAGAAGLGESPVLPFVVAGMAPAMTGALAGLGGVFAGSIVQSLTGLRGGAGGTLGGGAVGGGIGFAVGGPLGALIGAGIGSTLGPTVLHFLGSIFGGSSGEDYGKRFADGSIKPFQGIVTTQVGQQLRKQVADATDQLNKTIADAQHPAGHVVASGRGGGVYVPPTVNAQQSAQQVAKAQYDYGRSIAEQFLKGIKSVPYATTGGLLDAFDQQLRELSPKAGAEGKAAAAETMLQYAQTLVSEGKLPKDAITTLIRAMEQEFPGLTSYLKVWGAGTSAASAATLKLTDARNNLTQSLSAVRQDFVGASDFIAKSITPQNLFPNLVNAMLFLKGQIATGTGQARDEAIASFKQLEGQSSKYLRAGNVDRGAGGRDGRGDPRAHSRCDAAGVAGFRELREHDPAGGSHRHRRDEQGNGADREGAEHRAEGVRRSAALAPHDRVRDPRAARGGRVRRGIPRRPRITTRGRRPGADRPARVRLAATRSR